MLSGVAGWSEGKLGSSACVPLPCPRLTGWEGPLWGGLQSAPVCPCARTAVSPEQAGLFWDLSLDLQGPSKRHTGCGVSLQPAPSLPPSLPVSSLPS